MTGSTNPLRSPRPPAVIGPLVFASGLGAFVWAMLTASYNDADSYRAALFRDGIYAEFQLAGASSLDQMSHGLGFVYPPSSLLFLSPLALGEWMYPVIAVLSTALLVGAVLLIVNRERGLSPTCGLVIAGVMLAIFPTVDAAESGTVTAFMAAGLGFAWLTPGGANWLAAVGGLIKIYPAALVIWGIRGGSSLAGPLMLGAVIVGLTLVIWGPQVWLDYLVVLANAEPACNVVSRISLTCVTGSSIPGVLLALLLLVGVRRASDDYHAFALLSLAMLAPAPDVWPHYWLIPIVGFLPFGLRWMTRVRAAR